MVKDIKEEELEINTKNYSPIAHPLAPSKLQKKIYKTIKKGSLIHDSILIPYIASKQKHVKRGVKEVAKAIRKGEKGLVVLAADIAPVDVISHLPILCEEAQIPYCYVPSKQLLGESGLSKRPTSVIMLSEVKKKDTEYEESFDTVKKHMGGLVVLPSVCA